MLHSPSPFFLTGLCARPKNKKSRRSREGTTASYSHKPPWYFHARHFTHPCAELPSRSTRENTYTTNRPQAGFLTYALPRGPFPFTQPCKGPKLNSGTAPLGFPILPSDRRSQLRDSPGFTPEFPFNIPDPEKPPQTDVTSTGLEPATGHFRFSKNTPLLSAAPGPCNHKIKFIFSCRYSAPNSLTPLPKGSNGLVFCLATAVGRQPFAVFSRPILHKVDMGRPAKYSRTTLSKGSREPFDRAAFCFRLFEKAPAGPEQKLRRKNKERYRPGRIFSFARPPN